MLNMNLRRSVINQYIVILVCSMMFGCATTPPRDVGNLCNIFQDHPEWYQSAKKSELRWHLPISTQMAIMHQESKFRAHARPPRRTIFWIIPWTRPSTAYGYAQALDTTWSVYKRSTGHFWASRSNFKDGVDFIGWYAHQAHQRAGISLDDPMTLYLAYHEGIGGYQRGTHGAKHWLMQVARKVRTRAYIYEAQLEGCEAKLKSHLWHFF